MRRIYESDAVIRDDHPHTPANRTDRGSRAIDWGAASHALVPTALRDRAIEVQLETDRNRYPRGTPVGLRVTLRNRFPIPITLVTRSPRLWRWAVDGHPEASRIDRPVPSEPGALTFGRRERKTFVRRWSQSIRETATRWRTVEPGEYELTAWVNVPDSTARGLRDATTVRITSP